MAENQEIRASREEVEAFVRELRGFYGGLKPVEQHMLATILEGAQAGETASYGVRRIFRYGDPEEGGGSESSAEGWNDLVGWIEEQGEDDAQGFAVRRNY